MSTDPTTVDVHVTRTDTGWSADVSGVAGAITAATLEELQADVTAALAALFPDHDQPPTPVFRLADMPALETRIPQLFMDEAFGLSGQIGSGKSNALHLVMAQARMTSGEPSPATLAALLQSRRERT